MNFPSVLASLLCALVTCGCATKGKPPLVAECGKKIVGDRTGPALVGQDYGRQATPLPLDSVQFSNWDAAKSVAIQRLYATRTATGTVQITARFIACANEPVALLVRTSFLDANQAPSEPISNWQSVLVQPRLTGLYTEFSSSKNVSNYLIEIMPGH